MKEKITIFTPTYNRADLIERTYRSLQRQTNKDFVWFVIDDGSTDNTGEVIARWKQLETDFRIEYYYKENGGLQSGYVEAIKHLETELAMCIDSDDYLLDDAVESVLTLWNEKGSQEYAGILALDSLENGRIIGGLFPEGTETVNLIDLDFGKNKRTEVDRMLAIRSDLYKQAKPAKRYPGENTINATYLHLQIGLQKDFLVLNKPISVIEYQATGISKNKKKQYFDRPNTFADFRLFCLSLPRATKKDYVRHNLHYIAECLIAKRKGMIKDSPRKFETILLFPFGFALWLYLKKTVKK